jgi:hypothetical protein
MKIYRCKRTFLCTPLEKYMPAGAMVARYENATRLVIQDAPETNTNPFGVLVDGIVYEDPAHVTWMWKVEPPPLGTNTKLFELVASEVEDAYGNVGGTPDGLPSNSKLKVRTSDGQPFLQSATNGKWYPIRLIGTDGNVSLQVGQTGEVHP